MFTLNNMARLGLREGVAGLCFALIRRADAAIEDYEDGRNALARFCDERAADGSVSITSYFRAVRKLELAVADVEQSLQFMLRVPGFPRFTQGDGSPRDRLNLMYNSYRHVDPLTLPAGQIHAVWIEDDGIHAVTGAHFTFDELRESICDVSRLAEKLAKGELSAAPPTP